MKVKLRAALVICVSAALLMCAAFFIMHGQPDAPAPLVQSVAHANAQYTPADPSALLFPDLNSMHITSLTVSTPDRSFQFHLDKQGTVSVNGQQADSEIFSTLLDQISELPAERRSAFSPQQQKLLLTLVVFSGQKKQTARFYEDGSEGQQAHIILGPEDAPEYRQTNGWRVGTLMMTCEGTRVQDIHGNEMPAR